MIEIISPGINLNIQDFPGRVGYWNVGIPPSGPMDSLSFRITNKLLGNPEGTAALEITAMGPTLKFYSDCVIALGGAHFLANLNGVPLPWWRPISIKKGDILEIGAVSGTGFRCYLAVRGGLDVPDFLGSKSTFTVGGIGGLGGHILRKGDIIRVGTSAVEDSYQEEYSVSFAPVFPSSWSIGIIPGPHNSPQYVTERYEELFFQEEHRVNYNSDRKGIRLDSPKPEFARRDGGEGGSHPSNIIDTPYPIGGIIMSGDTPVILTADGPSFGGFIVFATVPTSELWKLGQLKLGEKIRFHRLSLDKAIQDEQRVEQLLSLL